MRKLSCYLDGCDFEIISNKINGVVWECQKCKDQETSLTAIGKKETAAFVPLLFGCSVVAISLYALMRYAY